MGRVFGLSLTTEFLFQVMLFAGVWAAPSTATRQVHERLQHPCSGTDVVQIKEAEPEDRDARAILSVIDEPYKTELRQQMIKSLRAAQQAILKLHAVVDRIRAEYVNRIDLDNLTLSNEGN